MVNRIRLMARLASLITIGVFLLIILFAVTNEDQPQPPAIFMLVFLALTILACLAAWRWETTGGGLVIASAVNLGLVAYSAATVFDLGALAVWGALLYSLPFVLVGGLFLLAGQTSRRSQIAK